MCGQAAGYARAYGHPRSNNGADSHPNQRADACADRQRDTDGRPNSLPHRATGHSVTNAYSFALWLHARH
jgi:hypothetical protein